MNKLFEYINNNFRTVECLLFVVMVCLMLINLYLDPIHKQNVENIGKNLYKFQDTLEFVDKDTGKVIKRFENVELRILDRNQLIYLTKVKENESTTREVIVNTQVPTNSYLRLNCLPLSDDSTGQ